MNKREVNEIKRRFTKGGCSFTRMCGCYVNGEHEKVTRLSKTFLNLDENEFFKYLEIAKKALSGTVDNNLLTLEFPMEEELSGEHHKLLLALRESKLKNEELLDTFYDLVIEHYGYVGNYLILLFHDAYDVPVKTTDDLKLDESEEVYEYILCAVCPVALSKPGLGYLEDENEIGLRLRDWVVGVPEVGFLFPAFTDRSADVHAALLYTKNTKEPPEDFMEGVLGCGRTLTATEQKEIFRSMIEEALGEECNYEVVREIHDKINEKIAVDEDVMTEEEPEPMVLTRQAVKELLVESGVSEEKAAQVERIYEEQVGEDVTLYAENVVDKRKFEVKTYDVVLHVKPEKASQIQSRVIDGHKYLVIPMEENENINVNGINTTV